jgi:Co/Zn/Cd efflux system component
MSHDTHDHAEHQHEQGAVAGHGHGHAAGHDHDHEHQHEHRGGLRGFLAETFRPHSHDSADSVDSALESSTAGIRAVKISLIALGLTAIAQAVVVVLTGSVALLADTIHNFSDALTAIPLWIAFVLGRRRPNSSYTYGYGRAEDLAGVFIVAMIALSSVVAGYESVHKLIDPQPLSHPWVVVAAGLLGFTGNEVVALLPDPGRPADRLSGAGRRRAARPHRRVHLPCRRHRCLRGSARIPDRGSAGRAADHRGDRDCCIKPSQRGSAGRFPV